MDRVPRNTHNDTYATTTTTTISSTSASTQNRPSSESNSRGERAPITFVKRLKRINRDSFKELKEERPSERKATMGNNPTRYAKNKSKTPEEPMGLSGPSRVESPGGNEDASTIVDDFASLFTDMVGGAPEKGDAPKWFSYLFGVRADHTEVSKHLESAMARIKERLYKLCTDIGNVKASDELNNALQEFREGRVQGAKDINLIKLSTKLLQAPPLAGMVSRLQHFSQVYEKATLFADAVGRDPNLSQTFLDKLHSAHFDGANISQHSNWKVTSENFNDWSFDEDNLSGETEAPPRDSSSSDGESGENVKRRRSSINDLSPHGNWEGEDDAGSESEGEVAPKSPRGGDPQANGDWSNWDDEEDS